MPDNKVLVERLRSLADRIAQEPVQIEDARTCREAADALAALTQQQEGRREYRVVGDRSGGTEPLTGARRAFSDGDGTPCYAEANPGLWPAYNNVRIQTRTVYESPWEDLNEEGEE